MHFTGIFLLFLFCQLARESNAQRNWRCNGACQRDINQANRLTDQYHQKENYDHNRLMQRIIKAEHEVHDNQHFHPEILLVPSLQKFVERNFTTLNKQMVAGFKQQFEIAELEFALLSIELDEKLKKLTRDINKLKKEHDHHNHHNDHGHYHDHWDHVSHHDVQDIYLKLSRRLDGLEHGKIANLINENKNSRDNFRAIKGPIEKFKHNHHCFCKW